MSDSRNTIPRYYGAIDFERLWAEFPPAPDYFETTYRKSRDELHAMQNERFLTQMKRAWQVPFTSGTGAQPAWRRATSGRSTIFRTFRRSPCTSCAMRSRAIRRGAISSASIPRRMRRCRSRCKRAAARPAFRGRCSIRRAIAK
jgi:hypothetical protein